MYLYGKDLVAGVYAHAKIIIIIIRKERIQSRLAKQPATSKP